MFSEGTSSTSMRETKKGRSQKGLHFFNRKLFRWVTKWDKMETKMKTNKVAGLPYVIFMRDGKEGHSDIVTWLL